MGSRRPSPDRAGGGESSLRRARRLCAGAETRSPTFSRAFPCGRPLTAQLSVSPAPAQGPWEGVSLTGRLFRRWRVLMSSSWTSHLRTASPPWSSAPTPPSSCWSPPGTRRCASTMCRPTPCGSSTSTLARSWIAPSTWVFSVPASFFTMIAHVHSNPFPGWAETWELFGWLVKFSLTRALNLVLGFRFWGQANVRISASS